MARKPLFERLPESWKYNDTKTEQLDDKGVLQRYLEVWDDGFDRSEDLAESVLSTRDTNTIPDKYLKLIGELVGHRWKDYRSYQWNRQRIRESISRYSYKGTAVAIADLVYEHGGSYSILVDNASLVDAWNIQGGMFFDADFFHPGVYQLTVTDDINFEHFIEDFQDIKTSGTKWYFRFLPVDTLAVCETVAHGSPVIRPYNILGEELNWWWDFEPQPPVVPEITVNIENIVVPLGASLLATSLSFGWDSEFLTFGEASIPSEYNHIQPLVDIDIPT